MSDDEMPRLNVLEALGETEIGNTVTIVPGAFPGYGPEQLLLRVPTKSQTDSRRHEASQALTIVIATYPFLSVNGHETHEPIVGRLQYGTGGGEAEVEFDIQAPKVNTADPSLAALTDDAGDVRYRYGLTVISFQAANFALRVRTDRNLRSIAPQNGVVADGTPAGGQLPAAEGVFPITVKAWVSMGVRPVGGTKVTKSIVIGELASLDSCAIPIPVGAQAYRIYRFDPVAGIMPALQVEQQTNDTTILARHNYPVDQTPTVQLSPSTEVVDITNIGPGTLMTPARIEFDIAL